MLYQGTVMDTLGDDTLRIRVVVPALYGESIVEAWPVIIPRHSIMVSCPDPECQCVHQCEEIAPAIGAKVWVMPASDGTLVWLGVHATVVQSASQTSSPT